MSPMPDLRPPAAAEKRDYGPEVTFEVLGAAHEPFAAQPTLRFELSVSEPTDRPIYAISRDRADQLRSRPSPVRRRDARGPVRALRRARALAVDDAQLPVVPRDDDGPLVHGRHDVRPRGAVHGRSRGRRRALRRGAARRRGPADDALHRAHPLRGARSVRSRSSTCRGRRRPPTRCPSPCGSNMMKHHHGESGFVLVHNDTMDALTKRKRARGLHSYDAVVLDLLEQRAGRRAGRGGVMSNNVEPITPESPSDVGITSSKSHLERLVDSLLFEGYALYPYTPGATKNATPTPFGIVYPHDYAQTPDACLRPHADPVHRHRRSTRSSPARCASCRRPARSTRPSSAACSSAPRRARSPSSSTSSRATRRSSSTGCPTAAAA